VKRDSPSKLRHKESSSIGIALKNINSLAHRPVITDGAWGTELLALGLNFGACPDEWNLTFPEHVQRVAQSYVDAGSEVILSNTFGSNRIVLRNYGLSEQTALINRRGAEISRAAAGKHVRVFAAMGPSRKSLARGEIKAQELSFAFMEQATALAEGGADALVLETFTDLNELTIAVAAAKITGLPVVACMVFDFDFKKDCTTIDERLTHAVTQLSEFGADVLGANCGRGVDAYLPVCERLKTLTQLPLWFKPNAGLPKMIEGNATYEISPVKFAKNAKTLVDKGASFIGGCCGCGPTFITELVRQFKTTSI
jgi:methionine synthase I (cobalamin-dependent)